MAIPSAQWLVDCSRSGKAEDEMGKLLFGAGICSTAGNYCIEAVFGLDHQRQFTPTIGQIAAPSGGCRIS